MNLKQRITRLEAGVVDLREVLLELIRRDRPVMEGSPEHKQALAEGWPELSVLRTDEPGPADPIL